MSDFKFSTLKYKRPDCDAFAAFAASTAERIERAESYTEVKEAFSGKRSADEQPVSS